MRIYKEIIRKLSSPERKPGVWILEKEKTGYLRIRKVASSSINHCLIQHLVKGNNQDDIIIDRALHKKTEASYSSHIPHAVIRRDLKGKYFLFAFVRNPLYRAWSVYKNKVNNPNVRIKSTSFPIALFMPA
jgi:hypothetical protein